MKTARVILLITVAGLAIAACTPLQFDTSDSGAQAARETQLAQQVPTYDENQLARLDNYIRAGEVETSLCAKSLLGGVTDSAVITALRAKALDAGANGLTDVTCQEGPSSGLGRCVHATACSATMIKIVN